MPLAVDQGLGILVWSPIAGGLLSGKYRRGVEAPAGSRHLGEWNEPPVHDEDKLYDTIEELVAIGEDHGVSAAQVALAYTIAKPAVTSVIVGARTDGAARGQPGRRRADAVGRRDGPAGRGQRPAAALPVLAPGQHLQRPAQRRRPDPARPPRARLTPVRRLAPGRVAERSGLPPALRHDAGVKG